MTKPPQESPIREAVRFNAAASAPTSGPPATIPGAVDPIQQALRGGPTIPTQAGSAPVTTGGAPVTEAIAGQGTVPSHIQPPQPGVDQTKLNPTQVNYEGDVWIGDPLANEGNVYRVPSQAEWGEIDKWLSDRKINLHPGWKSELAADPAAFIHKYSNSTGFGQFLSQKLVRPGQIPSESGYGKYYDQLTYNSALQRLRQSGLQGARQDEEGLLSMLAERGLLNSGIAARALSQIREARAQNYREGAQRLNEILTSSAADQAKREAILRLTSQLELANQSTLMMLKADLEQKINAELHKNDFLNTIVSGGVQGLTMGFGGGAAPPPPGGGTQVPGAYGAPAPPSPARIPTSERLLPVELP
jgi:hypothetical protein